jgi:hypothetical protein
METRVMHPFPNRSAIGPSGALVDRHPTGLNNARASYVLLPPFVYTKECS